MRPLRLTMCAFGPYAGTEVIDFEKALGARLFGIYGSTGSGKSSIFSAMTFALFGETARGGQDTESLRSHHADASTFTQVDFIFDIGAKRYLIRRTPEQERPAKRGDSMVKDNHSASLFDVTGMAADDITEKNTGKIIAGPKIRQVNEAICDLLGYGADQFRQIVLLPQGKFETFLTAKTEERLDILRELFDVSLFRNLTEKLKNSAGTARQEILNERKVTAGLLTENGYADLDDLAAHTNTKIGEIKRLGTAKETASKILAAAENALSEARSLDAHFIAKANAEARLYEFQDEMEEINQLRDKKTLGLKVRQAVDLEKSCVTAETALNQSIDEVHSAKANVDLSQRRFNDAEHTFTELEAQKPELKKQEEQFRLLNGYQKALDGTIEQKTRMDEARAKLDEARARVSQFESALIAQDEQKDQLDTKLKDSTNTERRRSELEKERDQTQSALTQAQAYAKAVSDRDAAQADLSESSKILVEVEARLIAARGAYDEAKSELASAQAHHLAKSLVDGEPCPVCGSKDHPDPYSKDLHGHGLNDAFEEAKAYVESVHAEFVDARTAFGAKEGVLEERKRALAEMDAPEEALDALQDRLDINQDLLGALPVYEEPDAIQAQIDAADENFKEMKGIEPEQRKACSDAEVAFRIVESDFAKAMAAIPQEYHDQDRITAAIDQCQNWIDNLTSKMTLANQEDVEAKSAFAAANATHTSSVTNFEKAKASRSAAQKNFEDRLVELGIDRGNYESGKAALDQIEMYNERIRAHEDGIATSTNAIKSAEEYIAGRARPDLTALEDVKIKAATNNEQAIIQLSSAQKELTDMQKLDDNVRKKFKELDATEEGFKILGRIADEFRGNNSSNINLETYAIAAMFDHVLEAANLRLTPMSGGRYLLQRSEEGQEKGRGKRGLGIAVFDTNTGRQRSTETLSGGESFLAALSLALGLSDVVQNTRGAVRLDTIFIDEGFGSLDPVSLDQALQTLQELTSGSRSVGIISHVDLVKQEIPQGFLIDKTLKGSRVIEQMLE
ncbi:SMC family ATPase [Magnetovibrio sp. PR-2]|uniref:SMC family ATPase n=1 Tax=Magnetovibrio sp. PR-2 TaxID=3120356 RepID=UPI002FCE09D7